MNPYQRQRPGIINHPVNYYWTLATADFIDSAYNRPEKPERLIV